MSHFSTTTGVLHLWEPFVCVLPEYFAEMTIAHALVRLFRCRLHGHHDDEVIQQDRIAFGFYEEALHRWCADHHGVLSLVEDVCEGLREREATAV